MKVSHRKQDRVDQQTRIRVGTQMSLKSGSKAMGAQQGSPTLLFDLQPYSLPHLCLSGASISLSTAAMISVPMAGKPPNGLSFTQHSSCYLHKHRITFLRTNFRMQGHISMGLVSTLTLGCTRHRRCSESALTCQHPLSPDGQAEVQRGRGCCSDLNNGPQRYPGSNLWNL